jgi:hypothetical protein
MLAENESEQDVFHQFYYVVACAHSSAIAERLPYDLQCGEMIVRCAS